MYIYIYICYVILYYSNALFTSAATLQKIYLCGGLGRYTKTVWKDNKEITQKLGKDAEVRKVLQLVTDKFSSLQVLTSESYFSNRILYTGTVKPMHMLACISTHLISRFHVGAEKRTCYARNLILLNWILVIFLFFVTTRHHDSFEGCDLVRILPTDLPELSKPTF